MWDYLEKINVASDETDDDSTNNNIVNENKQITKTLSEMLQQGNLVPHVGFTYFLLRNFEMLI